jgi:hypothetical protein
VTHPEFTDNLPEDGFKPRISLRGVNEALDALKESQPGTHCLVVYPDLIMLREIYSRYIKFQLEDRNEIVLILPYYETTDMVRLVLSGMRGYNNGINTSAGSGDSGIDVRRYEKEGSLIIIDSLKGYFDSEKEQQQQQQKNNHYHNNNNNNNSKNMGLISFLGVLLKHAERRRKDGVTVLSDMGSFYHNHSYNNHIQKLVVYEKSLPIKYDGGGKLKGFCLYHQQDFETRFKQGQQVDLLDCHSRNIMMMNVR